MIIYYTEDCLNYHAPGHPESPERVGNAARFLKEQGYSFLIPTPCTDAQILRVHTQTMLHQLNTGAFLDADTPSLPNIAHWAKLAAGAAVCAMESATQGHEAFSLMRPPGHHATATRIMGFCYLNNIAIAVSEYIQQNPAHRVAILDFDVHHGNGTENVFLGQQGVLYASTHQYPHFPGTGKEPQENALNFPLPPFAGSDHFFQAFDFLMDKIARFKPQLLAVSAGFDAYSGDPLAFLKLTIDDFKTIGQKIAALNVPTFHVLEGGYSDDFPQCIHRYLTGLENPHESNS